jgi:tRNA pseudouridine13 synthase
LAEPAIATEEMVGIKGYGTGSPGLGGRLRERWEDFVVEEVLADGAVVEIGKGLSDPGAREKPNGAYCHFALEKRGVDLFASIRRLAAELGASRKRFSYSGTKDARAWTCQMVSVRGLDPLDARTRDSRLRIHTPFRAEEPLRLGEHWGNSFRVRITGIPHRPGSTGEISGNAAREISAMGGVPNFYGYQRFGFPRANTHIVGRRILEGDFEGAVMEYLSVPYQGEDPQVMDLRRALGEDRDFGRALRIFPPWLAYERSMLAHLQSHPRDFLGALRRLPRNLLSLFPRAYQAYLFNTALSSRLAGKDPFEVREGDTLEMGHRFLSVGQDVSVQQARREVESGQARLVYSVIGYASKAEGPLSQDVLEAMDKEGVRSSLFYVRQLPDLSPKGSYRSLLVPVVDISLGSSEWEGIGSSLEVSFKLSRGSYATVVLREFMKAPMAAY